MRDFLGGRKAEHLSDWKCSICVVAYCRVTKGKLSRVFCAKEQ